MESTTSLDDIFDAVVGIDSKVTDLAAEIEKIKIIVQKINSNLTDNKN